MGSIVVEGLGKAYKQYPSKWARLVEWLSPWSAPRRRGASGAEEGPDSAGQDGG